MGVIPTYNYSSYCRFRPGRPKQARSGQTTGRPGHRYIPVLHPPPLLYSCSASFPLLCVRRRSTTVGPSSTPFIMHYLFFRWERCLYSSVYTAKNCFCVKQWSQFRIRFRWKINLVVGGIWWARVRGALILSH